MLALDHGIDVARRQDPGEHLGGNRCILFTDFLVENKGSRMSFSRVVREEVRSVSDRIG